MKLVYCHCSLYNPGGMERVLLNKVRWICAHTDWEVLIVTTDQQGRPPFYVLGVLRCGPVGLQVRRCVDLGHRLSVLIPAVEGIARPGRSRRQRHGLAVLGEDRGHIVAALGIEDDPVAGLDHRINIDGTGGEGNRTGLTAQRAAPAHM